MEYRSELKYLITDNDLTMLKFHLKNLMSSDEYNGYEKYNVKSIYFDTYDNKCFYENEAGVDDRFKMRIRIYNNSSDDIKLEIKYKKNGFTKKEFCNISKELCKKIIKGEKLQFSECNSKVLRQLYLKQNMNYLTPKIIVEYDRVAFTDRNGNVRITFDTDVRASKYINRFFNKNIFARKIIPDGINILEVKYDELIPDYISKELFLKKLEKTSFSKYYLSRIEFKEEIL